VAQPLLEQRGISGIIKKELRTKISLAMFSNQHSVALIIAIASDYESWFKVAVSTADSAGTETHQ